IAGMLRMELAQYRDLAAFAQFGSDLDKATREQLERGKRLYEVLKQDQYQPMPVEVQVVQIYAGTATVAADSRETWIRKYPVEDIQRYMKELAEHMVSSHPELLKQIRDNPKKKLDDEIKKKLDAALRQFAQIFKPSAEA
ncbi:MAG: F0F1 ATP synthase subunit alpha, partial [Deltaproteobacteria bacterium]|nr:F0F1 ATP synthase subunit alpha [Deltaproteobacteria bacterium]